MYIRTKGLPKAFELKDEDKLEKVPDTSKNPSRLGV